jgi:hypothetical protein
MKYLLLSFLFISMIGNTQTTDLLISEYGEGAGGSKKYIEIYNGTGADVDLSVYSLWKTTNGGAWSATTLALTGTLTNLSTFSIANNNIDVVGADLYNGSFISFNGNDAIGLAKNGVLIDALGEDNGGIAFNWPVAGVASGMVDKILIRKAAICSPNTNWTVSSGTNTTNSEWTISVDPYNAIGQTTNLGAHTNTCLSTCDTYSTPSISACETYTSPSGLYTWTTSNTYNDTIPNAALCDSIITIDLTINQPEAVSASASICTGQTYIFGTQTLNDTDAGIHTEVFSNMNTCDSTVTLTLSVVTGYTESAAATICEGETYIFGLQNITSEAGNPYTESFTSIGGCDSTVTLTLTVNSRTYETIAVTECDSYTSPSGNYTWTVSNTYNDTIPNTMMCDSVITINLTINNSTSASISETVCGSYDFLGTILTSTGVYVETIQNTMMCDSVITLTLDVTPLPNAPLTSADSAYCENDVLADMTVTSGSEFGELIIAGIADGPLPGGLPKVVEFYAIQNITDLSVFGFGSASNGGGTDGEEFTFPAISLTAGDHYYVSTDSVNFQSFYGFYPNYTEGTASNNNGDDAIELFKNGVVIDVFGEIDVDGTGTPWDYLDGWAYRNSNSSPNDGVFNISEWTFSGTNQLEGGVTNATCTVPFPIGTMSVTLPTGTFTWYSDVTLMTQIGTGASQSPTITNGATNYYVTETFSGTTSCESASSMVTITINTNPTNVTFAALNDICEGASNYTLVEGTPSGGVYSGTGVSAGTFNPATAGAGTETLTYTYTDGNNCSADATQTITVIAAPTATLAAFSTVCVYNPSMALTGGAPAGGTYSGPGVTGGDFDPATAGNGTHTITYTYVDGNNCEGSATNSITVDGCAGIDETNLIGLTIYPNPTNGIITIQFEGNTATISIVDLAGKTVNRATIQSNETIDISNLNAGTYFVNVDVNGLISTERVIIK